MGTINLTELAGKISELVNDYSIETKETILERVNQCADQILSYIKENAPRSNQMGKHLADSFIKTEVGQGTNKIIYISSKTKYQLVHLVELGFRHTSGKHIPGRPFLRPSYDYFTPKMLEEIKRIIINGTS